MKCGIDILEISSLPQNEKLEKFLIKYFNAEEIAYINTKAKKEQSIAGIFCAKEAFLKALEIGIGKIKLSDIIILHKENGAPFIKPTKNIVNLLNSLNFTKTEISISHAGNFATSICICE